MSSVDPDALAAELVSCAQYLQSQKHIPPALVRQCINDLTVYLRLSTQKSTSTEVGSPNGSNLWRKVVGATEESPKTTEQKAATSQKNASRLKNDLEQLKQQQQKQSDDSNWCSVHFKTNCSCKQSAATASTPAPENPSRPNFIRPKNPKSALIANGWIEQQRRSKMRVVWKEVLASLVEGRQASEETTLWIQREAPNTKPPTLEALHQIPVKWIESVRFIEFSADNRFIVKVYNLAEEFFFRCANTEAAQNWVMTLRSAQDQAQHRARQQSPAVSVANKIPPEMPRNSNGSTHSRTSMASYDHQRVTSSGSVTSESTRMPLKEMRAIAHGAGINTHGMERGELEAIIVKLSNMHVASRQQQAMNPQRQSSDGQSVVSEDLQAKEEAERRRKLFERQEEERRQKEEEQQRQQARQKEEEEQLRKKQEAEAKADEQRKQAEEKRRTEEEAAKNAAEAKRRAEEGKKQHDEEERKRLERERQQRDEEEIQRRVAAQRAEQEKRRQEEATRLQQETWKRQQDAWQRQQAEEAQRQRAAEEERRRQEEAHRHQHEAWQRQQAYARQNNQPAPPPPPHPWQQQQQQHHSPYQQQPGYPQQRPQYPPGHQTPPSSQNSYNGQPPPSQPQQQQQSAVNQKYANMANQSEDGSHRFMQNIKHGILVEWALQPPRLQTLRPIEVLITTIHSVFPPKFGCPGHEYFGKWKSISPDDVGMGTGKGAPDKEKLSKCVRKLRFFLHPDKLPRDLDDHQSFMCKMLWDITSDAYEEFKKKEEELGWING